MTDRISIVGAREHNLKNITVEIPRNALVVVTGLSGSGKSTLAFDTLYAEGQRRYVESLSAYARQFLDRLRRPDVDHIDGLSPAIAIEQRSAAANPRSTVATTTEIHDYLRLLYAHLGRPHCPACGRPIQGQSAQAIRDRILALPPGRRLLLLAPYVRGRKGEHRDTLEQLRKDGFVRARIDGNLVEIEGEVALDRNRPHDLEAVVDRLRTGSIPPSRAMDSVELALRTGQGTLIVLLEDDAAPGGWQDEVISEHLACPDCSLSFAKQQPRMFSFNNPYGACPECHGLGTVQVIRPDLLVSAPELSWRKGAMPVLLSGPRRVVRYHSQLLDCVAAHYGVDAAAPWESLPEAVRRVVLHGSGSEPIPFDYTFMRRRHRATHPFEGIIPLLQRRFRETESELVRDRLRQLMVSEPCSACQGARLKPQSMAVTVGAHSIHGFCSLSVERAVAAIDAIGLDGEEAAIGRDLLREIRARLGFLEDVGLGYLTLTRESASLSGGEAQRIRLATQLGSALVGVLYVLDEPSIGLHPRDTARLLRTLTRLRDLGNTVLVVEHDPATIRAADYVVDLGPGAGRHGGELVFAGSPQAILDCGPSLTGQFLSGRRGIAVPPSRHPGNGATLTVHDAAENNLKGITARFPLNTLCCVTGVSGSGKSTLVNAVLKRAVQRHLGLKTQIGRASCRERV